MIVPVKQTHIQSGVPQNCHKCPVALALNEAVLTRNGTFIVDRKIMGIVGFPHKFYYQPRSVQRFVVDFDLGKKVKPFCFKLKELKKNKIVNL